MKIVSQDANILVAADNQYATLATGMVLGVVGLGVLGAGIAGGQAVLKVIGGVLVAIGGLMIVTLKQRTLTVDKGTGLVTFDLKSFFNRAAHQYPIGDVVKVEFTTSIQTTSTPTTGQSQPGISFGTGGIGMRGGNTQTTQQTQVHLMLKDGTVIDLADGQRSMSSMSVFSKVPNLEVAQQIAAFIGVPFEQQGAATLDQMASQVRNAVMGQTEPPSVVPAQTPEPPADAAGPEAEAAGVGAEAPAPSDTPAP